MLTIQYSCCCCSKLLQVKSICSNIFFVRAIEMKRFVIFSFPSLINKSNRDLKMRCYFYLLLKIERSAQWKKKITWKEWKNMKYSGLNIWIEAEISIITRRSRDFNSCLTISINSSENNIKSNHSVAFDLRLQMCALTIRILLTSSFYRFSR